MKWAFLAIAIVCETIATSALKYSDGFKKLVPSIVVVVCYLTAFYFLSLTLRQIPVGIAYAIWSGMGIVLITIFGYFVFKQILDVPAIIGMGLIISGTIVVSLFSKSVAH